MASIDCPFCTKPGIVMVLTGLALVILSAALTLPWLMIIGLIIIIAAYIIPSLVTGESCHRGSCASPNQSTGENESHE